MHSLDNSGRTPLHLAASRLRLIHSDSSFTSEQLKAEVAQVVDMMKEYLVRAGQREDVGQLDQLCSQLQRTSTKEEVSSLCMFWPTQPKLTPDCHSPSVS